MNSRRPPIFLPSPLLVLFLTTRERNDASTPSLSSAFSLSSSTNASGVATAEGSRPNRPRATFLSSPPFFLPSPPSSFFSTPQETSGAPAASSPSSLVPFLGHQFRSLFSFRAPPFPSCWHATGRPKPFPLPFLSFLPFATRRAGPSPPLPPLLLKVLFPPRAPGGAESRNTSGDRTPLFFSRPSFRPGGN